MNNISQIDNRCTGCSACLNRCPKQAIRIRTDEEGFWYPELETDRCVDCGLCLSVCPVHTELEPSDTRIRAYYGAVNDATVVKKSSSGGAFSLMAEHVLQNGGLVCGAALNYDKMELVYMSTDTTSLDVLRKSKYIAPNPQHIFAEVATALQAGRQVLFCGLPCHVHGLKTFLKKDNDKLIACDFICGGTASPQFFREHLQRLEKKYHGTVTHVDFRAKLFGWKEHSIKIAFSNGKTYNSLAFFDSFFKGYFEKPYQRDSCYHCSYRLGHASDIIIADYWDGLQKGRGNEQGVSMVITNSAKGDSFFEAVLQNDTHNFKEMPLSDSNYVFKREEARYTIAYRQKQSFLTLYRKYGFEKAASKSYFKGVLIAKLKRKAYKIVNKIRSGGAI